jgi:hypothetical protein
MSAAFINIREQPDALHYNFPWRSWNGPGRHSGNSVKPPTMRP